MVTTATPRVHPPSAPAVSVGAEVPLPPPVSLLPSWEPVTLEALEDAQEENSEEGDADVAPTRPAATVSDVILVVDQDARDGSC